MKLKEELLIEDILKFLFRYKYYFLVAIISALISTLIHVSVVKKIYKSFINIKLSPDYLSIVQNVRDFKIYADNYEKNFFDQNELSDFFKDETLNIVSNIDLNSSNKFLKNNKKIELEKSENLIRVIINSNNIQLISKLYDYSQRINLVQTREFFDREQYFEINFDDIKKKIENYSNINGSYEEVLNFKDYFDLLRINEKKVKVKEYILVNNIKIFNISYPSKPELIYPKKLKFFINYFILFNIITIFYLIFFNKAKKNKKK